MPLPDPAKELSPNELRLYKENQELREKKEYCNSRINHLVEENQQLSEENERLIEQLNNVERLYKVSTDNRVRQEIAIATLEAQLREARRTLAGTERFYQGIPVVLDEQEDMEE